MKTLFAIQIMFFLSLSGCAVGYNAAMHDQEPKYSVVVEGSVEDAFLDGLPRNVDIATVNKLLLKKLDANLATRGMKNNTKDVIVAKYEIYYFGHKFMRTKAKYIIKYNLEVKNKINGNIRYTKKQEAFDADIHDLIDEVSGDILKRIAAFDN